MFLNFYTVTSLSALTAAKSLWSDSPGNYENLIETAFPLGNGRLGAMPLGMYDKEIVNLNVDSLWRGGPFEDKVCSLIQTLVFDVSIDIDSVSHMRVVTPHHLSQMHCPASGSSSSSTELAMCLLCWVMLRITGRTRFWRT